MSHQIEIITSVIRMIRGKKVILDTDLARIYGVTTKRLNEQVKRNAKRFPSDFLFQLTTEEIAGLNRSQFATGSQKHRDPRLRPYAFTENGAIMAANVLNSSAAVRMSVFVVRAFVQMRNLLGSTKELAKQLAALEKKLTERLDGHEAAIVDVLRRLMDILDPPRCRNRNRQNDGSAFTSNRKKSRLPERGKRREFFAFTASVSRDGRRIENASRKEFCPENPPVRAN